MRSAPIDGPEQLGLVLREAHMRRGKSQRELARDLDVSQRYVVQLESGSNPTLALQRLFDFAHATGITLYAELAELHPSSTPRVTPDLAVEEN